MIQVPIPQSTDGLVSALIDIVRRAVDGTVVPLIVDYTNQRVLIGATAAQTSGTNGKVEITGGDVRIVDSGKGLIVTTPDGSKQFRIVVDNDGRLEAYQV